MHLIGEQKALQKGWDDVYAAETSRRSPSKDFYACSCSARIRDRLARIDKFSYDSEQDVCFNMWYNRHKDIFDIDCAGIEEKGKTRLLVSAIDAMSFSPNEDIDIFVNSLKARALEANFKEIKHESSKCLAMVEVDDNSKELLTINTHRGLYRYNRLPFGVKSAPGIVRQIVDLMTSGLNGVAAYLDDVIVTGRTLSEHNANLEALFSRISAYGFRVRIDKCHFVMNQLTYLRNVISAAGRRPDPKKIDAITQMPKPKDTAQVKSFLGLINHYGAFVPKMRQLQYRNTRNFGQTDALSCLIAAQSPPEEDVVIAKIAHDINTSFNDNVNRLSVTAKEVAHVTAEDDTLRQVLGALTHNNWPKKKITDSC
ncbi:hypothetical protein TELCIR_02378 [Teladorsagia circumcincta]|uniref:Uncharacterized protein n=1 Tax=Teladorsagia circumcincta TaxID=45464 RepID=A0A2G9UZK6_TELCI|nr:hypothetical protein TELCIR_02378 [Teladorsagia circumcincta]